MPAIEVLGLKQLIGLEVLYGFIEFVEIPDRLSNCDVRGRLQHFSHSISDYEHGLDGWVIAVLIQPPHVCSGAPRVLRRHCVLATDADGIQESWIIWQNRFETIVTSPGGDEVVDVEEPLAAVGVKIDQLHVKSISQKWMVLRYHLQKSQIAGEAR
jgi:hypothetical protein